MSDDTVAVDRETLVEALRLAHVYTLHNGGDKIREEIVDHLLTHSGVFLDVAAVRADERHEHGERIAKALQESDAPDWAVAMVLFVSREPS